MPDVFVRVKLSEEGLPDAYVGRWIEVPIVPRIGDKIHYGDNWPADCVAVNDVELWCWKPCEGVIICNCEETQLEELSDTEEAGIDYYRRRLAEFEFRKLEDAGDWFAGD